MKAERRGAGQLQGEAQGNQDSSSIGPTGSRPPAHGCSEVKARCHRGHVAVELYSGWTCALSTEVWRG
jgi:hypothetical protein